MFEEKAGLVRRKLFHRPQLRARWGLILPGAVPSMPLRVVQLWSRHHSSLGMGYPFLVAFEQGEQYCDELAGDAADHLAFAMVLSRTLVIDALARRQVGVPSGCTGGRTHGRGTATCARPPSRACL